METTVGSITRVGKTRQIVSWTLIGILLFIRIGILGVGGLRTQSVWWDALYQISTYFFAAVFLWWEIKNLKEFHVDLLVLLILIVFKPMQTLILLYWRVPNLPLTFPSIPALSIWAIALGLAIACFLRRKDLPRFEWKSLGFFGIGTFTGILLAVLLAVPMSYQISQTLTPGQFWIYLRQDGLVSFIYQIGYAGVSEEPLFRAFLWGALRRLGWRDVWIWLFQAGLFILAHMYYFGKFPISMSVIVPVGALALGLVAWKTRSISISLAFHGATNSLGALFGSLARYLLRN
jgi:membrane protease YdiL (CAAX protease family)